LGLLDRLLRLVLPLVPRFIVGRVARRYIAGPPLDDALRVVGELNREGALATLDFLGEEARAREQAERAVGEYLRALEGVHAARLDCNLSLKPTLFGLRIDEQLCLESLERVVAAAAARGTFVRLDMEDHGVTDATLRLHRELAARHGNVGVALQAMLRRTPADAGGLAALRANVRLCKGIYREPRALAWQAAEAVRASFVHLLDKLLGAGCYVGIATHDEQLLCAALAAVDRLGLGPAQYELQMLLGVEPELRRIMIEGGHRVRVYVPYGTDWHGYSVRRLRESPAIARHVLRALFWG
jgi:proline dehydrogenase